MERERLSREIIEIMSRIWSYSVGLPIEALNMDSSQEVTPEQIDCQIDISGVWPGCLHLSVPARLANRIGSKMFQIKTRSKPSESQVEDCLKEITNMLAGNLKTILPEPCTLGFARVLPQMQGALTEDQELLRLQFVSEQQSLHVWLFKDSEQRT